MRDDEGAGENAVAKQKQKTTNAGRCMSGAERESEGDQRGSGEKTRERGWGGGQNERIAWEGAAPSCALVVFARSFS